MRAAQNMVKRPWDKFWPEPTVHGYHRDRTRVSVRHLSIPGARFHALPTYELVQRKSVAHPVLSCELSPLFCCRAFRKDSPETERVSDFDNLPVARTLADLAVSAARPARSWRREGYRSLKPAPSQGDSFLNARQQKRGDSSQLDTGMSNGSSLTQFMSGRRVELVAPGMLKWRTDNSGSVSVIILGRLVLAKTYPINLRMLRTALIYLLAGGGGSLSLYNNHSRDGLRFRWARSRQLMSAISSSEKSSDHEGLILARAQIGRASFLHTRTFMTVILALYCLATLSLLPLRVC